MCYDNEEWCKFEKKLFCQFKTDMKNFKKFDPTTQKSQKYSL